MAVLNRSTLQDSPLADLHELAGEFGLEGFRRMRKNDLIAAILKSQGIEDEGPPPEDEAPAGQEQSDDSEAEGGRPERRSRRSRGGRSRADRDGDRERDRERAPRAEAQREDRTVTGKVDLVGNGSGFIRVDGHDDVYVSAAQVRRCELVDGDEVSGPVRPPRRSERYSSLIRVDTINGNPADEVAGGTRFEELAVAFPSERIAIATSDKVLKAADAVAPIGKGTRATICGASHAGKSVLLRSYAAALAADADLSVTVVLAGVRPEEVADWPGGDSAPDATLTFDATPDAQAQAVASAIDTARRVAARGGDAVVLIDSLDSLSPGAARRALGSARNIADGGSLTVVAVATVPLGIETTIVGLDVVAARAGKDPLDKGASGTLREDLLAKPAAKKKAAAKRKPAARKKPAAKADG